MEWKYFSSEFKDLPAINTLTQKPPHSTINLVVLHLQMLTLLPLCLLALVSLSSQQCLTPNDSVRKISQSAADNLLQSELRFSTDLLHAVSSMHPDQNVIFSPTSVFKAMLLAYFISANKTETGLKRALHLAANEVF